MDKKSKNKKNKNNYLNKKRRNISYENSIKNLDSSDIENSRKYFMARVSSFEKNKEYLISPFIFSHTSKKYSNIKSRNKEINLKDYNLKKEYMNFERNKENARKIFESISLIENEEEKIENIYKCLSFDNVSKNILEGCLDILSNMKKDEHYYNIIEYNKFSLPEKYTQNILNDCPTMTKEILIKYYKYLYNTIETYFKITKNFDEKEIHKLIEFELYEENDIYLIKDKIIIKNDDDFTKYINDINKLNVEITNDIIEEFKLIKDESFNFLSKYIFLKEMDFYTHNQPIEKITNEILYNNYLLSYLYNKIIIYDGKTIKFNSDNFKIIHDYKLVFEKILFQENKETDIDKVIEILNFNLEASTKRGIDLPGKIIEDEKKAQLEEMDKIVANLEQNNNDLHIEKISDNEIRLKTIDFGDIDIDITKYNQNLINILKNNVIKNFDFLFKEKLIKHFNNSNYFSKRDLDYFHLLIEEILKSPVMKEIYNKHCDNQISEKIYYFFDDQENRKYFINKITFLPYNEENCGIQGLISRNELKIFLCGYPIKNFYLFNKADKILELSKRVIIIIHEIAHFLKCALWMLSNGLIANKTIDDNINNYIKDKLEAGRFIEAELFGFGEGTKNSPDITINQALKLLKCETYYNSIDDFRKYLNNKEKVIINGNLKNYLIDIGFDFDQTKKNSDINSKNTMYCGRINQSCSIKINSNYIR